MITNLPTAADFEKLANNCLLQAFDIIFETDKVIFEIGDKALKDDVWIYSQGKLNTAVVLIHQAIEAFMKASVCNTSPLLLLEGKRTDWPVLPDQKDKDFNDFYTTPAEALLRTYAATSKETLEPAVIKHVEEIRKLRNQIVHGISKSMLSPKRLIENILDTYLYFQEPDAWWGNQVSEFVYHPMADHYNFGFQLSLMGEKLVYAEATIGKAKFNKLFSINTKARRYTCPMCNDWWNDGEDGQYPYKWAFFLPDSTKKNISPQVFCLNCRIYSDVVKSSCYYTLCKGDVIYYGETPEEIICLTCCKQQFSGTEAEFHASEVKRLKAKLEALPKNEDGSFVDDWSKSLIIEQLRELPASGF